jgi:hypothetical protein
MQYGVVFPQIEFGHDPQAIKDSEGLQSLCSNAPHGSVTAGCRREGHRTTG